MGYNTDFTGMLRFKNPLTREQEAKLSTFLGEDCRDHPEWERDDEYLTYIDLEFSDDGEGLIWDGSEKTYDMVEKINLILREMRKEFPNFEFEGGFDAFGEIGGDVWKIIFEDGWAVSKEGVVVDSKTLCPHCNKPINS